MNKLRFAMAILTIETPKSNVNLHFKPASDKGFDAFNTTWLRDGYKQKDDFGFHG